MIKIFSKRKKAVKALIISLSLVFLAIMAFVIWQSIQKKQIITQTEVLESTYPADSAIQKVAKIKYGLLIDSFEMVVGKVKPNQILSNLFQDYDVPQARIVALADSAKDVFSVRKIRTGKNYVLLIRQDSIPRVHYLIYEKNAVDYVVFQLYDSIRVYEGQHEVDTVIRELGGIIHSSLWVAMHDAGASPFLINAMSDVFAWEINFFRVNEGDQFRLIYEEKQVNNEAVGIGRILAAEFVQNEESHFAIMFKQGRDDYFDEEGNCLRKMLLKAPLNYSRISSHFSHSRFHPVLKRYRPHHGVDYAAPYGTPVQTVGDGLVVKAAYSGGAGNMVKIEHNSVYTTAYLHLSKYRPGIRKGVKVKQGDVIGYVGSTGLSTGPHLDYRVWKNGSNVNPLNLDLPPVEAVADSSLPEFNLVKEKMIKELEKISFD